MGVNIPSITPQNLGETGQFWLPGKIFLYGNLSPCRVWINNPTIVSSPNCLWVLLLLLLLLVLLAAIVGVEGGIERNKETISGFKPFLMFSDVFFF